MKNEKAMNLLKDIAENPNKIDIQLEELKNNLGILSQEYIRTKSPQIFDKFLQNLFTLDKLYKIKGKLPEEIFEIVANVYGFITMRLKNSENKHFAETEDELDEMSRLQIELYETFMINHLNEFRKYFGG